MPCLNGGNFLQWLWAASLSGEIIGSLLRYRRSGTSTVRTGSSWDMVRPLGLRSVGERLVMRGEEWGLLNAGLG